MFLIILNVLLIRLILLIIVIIIIVLSNKCFSRHIATYELKKNYKVENIYPSEDRIVFLNLHLGTLTSRNNVVSTLVST